MAGRLGCYFCARVLFALSLLLCCVNAGRISVLQTKVSDKKGLKAGLYLNLKHRDAPKTPFLQPRYKSRQELLQIVLERDEVRANGLVEQRQASAEVAVEDSDSPPDPTGEGIPWLWPPAGAGEYYTELYVGTPRQLQVAMVDLASDVVWLGKSTVDSLTVSSHFFDPSSSSSFKPVPSTSNAGISPCRPSLGKLEFAYEDIRLNQTAERNNIALREILISVSPVQVPTGGVLGLGRGRTSFGMQVATTFAYCLADTDEPSGSSLVFDPVVQDRQLASTPLVSHPTFYVVNLAGMAVNGKAVPVASKVIRAIVDMSTRFTRLPECVLEHVLRAVKAKVKVGLATTTVPGFHLCYRLANPSQLRRLPTLALVFEGGARMALPVENVFVSATEQGDVVCLAMVAGQPGTVAVIGSTLQQNFLMLLDRPKARLRFAPRQCASVPTS